MGKAARAGGYTPERVGSGECENWLCPPLNSIQLKKINKHTELAGQKASQAADKAQEGWVGAKVKLQLGYPVLVMTSSSLGFVFLTLPGHVPAQLPLCASPLCTTNHEGLGWGRTSLVAFKGSSAVSTILSLSQVPAVLLLLLLGKRRGFVGYRKSLADFPPSGADQCQGYREMLQHLSPLGGLFDQVCNRAGTPPTEGSSLLTGTSQPGHRIEGYQRSNFWGVC